jgi:hypothetical protein
MSPPDGFDATFRVRLDRRDAWNRLTGGQAAVAIGEQLWLPGFDSKVSVVDTDPGRTLHVSKADEPCAGTDIVVTLEDDATGTRIHVVQSGFGDWFADLYDVMAIGWRHIVADLHLYLATGVHARRHLRPWGDLGANSRTADGGIRVDHVRSGGLAERLGLLDGDLLVTLAGAPVASLDDLTTVLRAVPAPSTAEWIRAGALMSTAGPH